MLEVRPTTAEATRDREASGPSSGPLPPRSAPQLSVVGFEGPLDFLLEMVRRQRVNLAPLSILALTDQMVAAIEAGEGRIPLERRADWLVARPQLGQAVFGREQSTPPPARPRTELLVAFLEATLVLLEGREGRTAEPTPTYRPNPPDLWRIPDALRRIAELLQLHPASLTLERCLPTIPERAPDRPIRLRAALASTFVAGLEMAREGAVTLVQEHAFGTVTLAVR